MMGPVYVITDPGAPWPVADQVRAAVQGGASLVQLRDKHSTDADFAALVTTLLPDLSARGVTLIVNDRIDVAIATGAHGLHVGQHDGDPLAIRRRIPSGMLLGVSIENEAQAQTLPACVDYIGAGPVRATATKPDHAPPINFDGLARIVSRVRVPTYAIGGLTHDDAARVKATGAAGMAVVSTVTRAADPEAATRALVAAWSAA
jgi:thiamine-phosphate pyrophosphorylase